MDRHPTAALLMCGVACGPAGAVMEPGPAGDALPERRDIHIHVPQGGHPAVFRNLVS